MSLPYDHTAVEARWRARWAADGRHDVDLDRPDGNPLYNLVEFPYPSAAGLHIGHALTYSGADVWGRYQRRRGRHVFQPIGFDAFGINAENYALRAGQHPGELIATTIANYRRQLNALGGAWSWKHQVTTSDPGYYRFDHDRFATLATAGRLHLLAGQHRLALRTPQHGRLGPIRQPGVEQPQEHPLGPAVVAEAVGPPWSPGLGARPALAGVIAERDIARRRGPLSLRAWRR